MSPAEKLTRLIEWIGDQAPLADAGPEAWRAFKERARSLILDYGEACVDEWANRDRSEEIADAVGDAELEARRQP